MTVFYTTTNQGQREVTYIKWLTDVIFEEDVSWWIVPGTEKQDD